MTTSSLWTLQRPKETFSSRDVSCFLPFCVQFNKNWMLIYFIQVEDMVSFSSNDNDDVNPGGALMAMMLIYRMYAYLFIRRSSLPIPRFLWGDAHG